MGNKIHLRAVEPEDVDFIYDCESDPDNARWSDYRAPFSKSQLMTYALTYDADPFSAGELRLIIEDEEKKRLGIIDLYDISHNDLKAFVGICIHPQYREKGYGSEALKELDKLATERLGLRKIAAKVSALNAPALDFFKKSGYLQTAVLPEWHKIGSQYHDIILLVKN